MDCENTAHFQLFQRDWIAVVFAFIIMTTMLLVQGYVKADLHGVIFAYDCRKRFL